MLEPYRENARVDPATCKHPHKIETVLKGGSGPDYAGWELNCPDCGSHGWRFMPPYAGNVWYLPRTTGEQ